MKQKLTSAHEAAQVIQREGIIIHETDTVFGISGDYRSLTAYDLIYKTKKRSETKPLGILISEISEIELFSDISLSLLADIIPLLEKGITILVPIKKGLPKHLTLQSDYIGLRIPDHIDTKEIIKVTGPLISTSANISGLDPVTTYQEALPLLDMDVYYLEGKGKNTNIASTILRYEDGNYTLIREGNVCKGKINMHVTLSFNINSC